MITIISFGYGHGPAPEADISVDLRRRFRNPHADPDMMMKTASDAEIFDHVMETEGIRPTIRSMISLAMSLEFNTGGAVIAFGCGGGRHRAPAVAMAVKKALRMSGHHVTLTHRDMEKPVLPQDSTH